MDLSNPNDLAICLAVMAIVLSLIALINSRR